MSDYHNIIYVFNTISLSRRNRDDIFQEVLRDTIDKHAPLKKNDATKCQRKVKYRNFDYQIRE